MPGLLRLEPDAPDSHSVVQSKAAFWRISQPSRLFFCVFSFVVNKYNNPVFYSPAVRGTFSPFGTMSHKERCGAPSFQPSPVFEKKKKRRNLLWFILVSQKQAHVHDELTVRVVALISCSWRPRKGLLNVCYWRCAFPNRTAILYRSFHHVCPPEH